VVQAPGFFPSSLVSNFVKHDQTLSSLFTLNDRTDFVIIAIYVDDLNLIGTLDTCSRVMSLLTTQFEMKLLGNTTICLGLKVAHLLDGSIFLHQTPYIQNLLKMFHMDQTNPLSAPMVE
jgi:hypothetical protein